MKKNIFLFYFLNIIVINIADDTIEITDAKDIAPIIDYKGYKTNLLILSDFLVSLTELNLLCFIVNRQCLSKEELDKEQKNKDFYLKNFNTYKDKIIDDNKDNKFNHLIKIQNAINQNFFLKEYEYKINNNASMLLLNLNYLTTNFSTINKYSMQLILKYNNEYYLILNGQDNCNKPLDYSIENIYNKWDERYKTKKLDNSIEKICNELNEEVIKNADFPSPFERNQSYEIKKYTIKINNYIFKTVKFNQIFNFIRDEVPDVSYEKSEETNWYETKKINHYDLVYHSKKDVIIGGIILLVIIGMVLLSIYFFYNIVIVGFMKIFSNNKLEPSINELETSINQPPVKI